MKTSLSIKIISLTIIRLLCILSFTIMHKVYGQSNDVIHIPMEMIVNIEQDILFEYNPYRDKTKIMVISDIPDYQIYSLENNKYVPVELKDEIGGTYFDAKRGHNNLLIKAPKFKPVRKEPYITSGTIQTLYIHIAPSEDYGIFNIDSNVKPASGLIISDDDTTEFTTPTQLLMPIDTVKILITHPHYTCITDSLFFPIIQFDGENKSEYKHHFKKTYKKVTIKSTPTESEGAHITIDSKPAGVTPLQTRLEAGDHIIRLQKEGFCMGPDITVNVNPCEPCSYKIDMMPWGRLSINLNKCNKIVENILVNNKPRGTPPLKFQLHPDSCYIVKLINKKGEIIEKPFIFYQPRLSSNASITEYNIDPKFLRTSILNNPKFIIFGSTFVSAALITILTWKRNKEDDQKESEFDPPPTPFNGSF